ncbi:MAG: sensor domain-containing diguanylate cyclase [Silvanigrellales bacterium]|jgi:diguanylate cyclase (GGDEF)-like protein/PAS domain S-box-containing protein|nr:sensor domain-containing diguanylate cyclase [Silvanigrellales bacterium]
MATANTATSAESQTILDSRLIEQFEVHREFTRIFLDAFVLVNREQRVIKFNQMFCTISGLRAIDVRKAPTLNAILTTQIHNSEKSALEMILEASGPLRIDEVQATKVASGESMQLIMGSFPYFDAQGNLLGACVVLRDVTAESNLQGKYTEKSIQSVTDPLTGLYTRRYFEDFIDKELDRARAAHKDPSLGLLMFDLDKFKSINDGYGHQAGDFVLQETAKILRSVARQSDILGRYGGEEMLVLLLNATPKGACIAAEKFRVALQNHEFIFEGKRIPVTTSVGVTVFLNQAETRDVAVKRADECLYAAKHNGRNVCFADFGEGTTRVPESTLLEGAE